MLEPIKNPESSFNAMLRASGSNTMEVTVPKEVVEMFGLEKGKSYRFVIEKEVKVYKERPVSSPTKGH